ncbi:MAG: dephospho-CoA kinase [Terracidiphilus sp.]
MLRVGLTGGLGSGKSTVAAMLRELGAHVIEADALGREFMEPGHEVYDRIVAHFGPGVILPDGHLDRARLADLAFRHGRLQELNAIVHPPVIAAQQRWMEEVFAHSPSAVAVVESALIFEVVRDARARGESDSVLAGTPGDRSSSLGIIAGWRRRIDRIIVVTAPDEIKIARYAARIQSSVAGGGSSRPGSPPAVSTLEAIQAEARTRLAHQVPDAEKAAQADYVLDNSGDIAALRAQVQALWPRLLQASIAQSNKPGQNLSLQ